MTPGLKTLSPALKQVAAVLAVALLAGAAMASRAEATPQFAAVGQSLGQSLGHVVPEATPVTYYNNNRYRPRYRNNRGNNYWRYRYAQPYYRWKPPYYRYQRYGYGYRGPNFYLRFGW